MQAATIDIIDIIKMIKIIISSMDSFQYVILTKIENNSDGSQAKAATSKKNALVGDMGNTLRYPCRCRYLPYRGTSALA